MRVVVPVAGLGKRMHPLTDQNPKCLLQVGNRAVLAHILGWVEGFASEVVFVLPRSGTWQHTQIRDYALGYRGGDFKMRFVEQPKPEGSGQAVWLALQDMKQSRCPVLIVNGDALPYGETTSSGWTKKGLLRQIAFDFSAIGIHRVSDPENHGVIEVDKKWYVSSITEKPVSPKSDLVMSGVFYIREAHLLFNALDVLIRHNVKLNNEFHLTAGLRHMLAFGESFYTWWLDMFDCGSHEGLEEARLALCHR